LEEKRSNLSTLQSSKGKTAPNSNSLERRVIDETWLGYVERSRTSEGAAAVVVHIGE